MFFQLFCWKYLKFTRPLAFKTNGKFLFNYKSSLKFVGNCLLSIEGNFDITNSKIVFIESSIEVKNFNCVNSHLEIKESKIICATNTQFKNSSIKLYKSTFIANNDLRIINYSLNFNQSEIKVGSFFLCEAALNHKPHFNILNGKVECKDNCRIQAYISINEGQLKIGSNSFINHGTLISCIKSIEIGDYVMISYDCVLIDNNSHATDFKSRREEIDNGFPNGVVQNENTKPVCKAIYIGNDVWVGLRSIILKGVTIGNKVIVGAGSIVSKDLAEEIIFVNK